jgi:hypothetical protein
MITTRNIKIFFLLAIFALKSQGHMPDKDFNKILGLLDSAIKLIGNDSFSPAQKIKLADKLEQLMGGEDDSEESQDIPAHCKVMYEGEEGGKFILSPFKSESHKKRKLNNEPKNIIYTHSVYKKDYFANYIDHENRIDVAQTIANQKKLYPKESKNIQKNYVMLHIEKHFRELMRDNPNLIKVIKYAGLAQDDSHRAYGHSADLRNPLKCSNAEKAKCETEYLKYANIRMNTLLYNIPADDLPLYEKLMAEIFQVQVNGCSAVIANEAATARYLRYKNWTTRNKELKKAKLDTIVEEQSKALVQRSICF